jgi:hypothetical protein
VASPRLRALKLPQNTTIHGQLAAFLALKYQESDWDHKAWQEVWPTQEEFSEILPIFWCKAAEDLLPHAAKSETNLFYHRDLDKKYSNVLILYADLTSTPRKPTEQARKGLGIITFRHHFDTKTSLQIYMADSQHPYL